jgi:hypothetical protein
MNRRVFFWSSICSLPLLRISAQTAGATLEAAIKYTGSGPVNASHKVYVALWDSPDFVKDDYKGPPPFSVQSLESKSGTVTFKDVQKNPVYLSMAYDPAGKWQGDSDPPEGASLGLFSQSPGQPAAVDLSPEKTKKISATLDDSFKNQRKQ